MISFVLMMFTAVVMNEKHILTIRDKDISPPLLLAPMAGLTHSCLRRLILYFGGIGLLSTEMLSARRLPAESPRVSPWLITTEEEREKPLSYQLLLADENEVVPALHVVHKMAGDMVDINLGCPAPKVSKSGGGSGLAANIEKTERVVALMRANTSLPLTAKIRLGKSLEGDWLKDFCQMLVGAGVDMITVHARLTGESFARKPHWERAGRVKDWVDVPVVVNGGIFSVADAQKCLRISQADGLMIGRAAAEKPWLFADIGRDLYGLELARKKISLPEVYARFVINLAVFPFERRLGRLKEFTHYFAHNYAFGHHLAMGVQKSDGLVAAWTVAKDFFIRSDKEGWHELDIELQELVRDSLTEKRVEVAK